MYDYVAFDLDGTLTDPEAGLIAGFVYAFRKLNIDCTDRSALRRFIGPPLFDEWQRVFGFTPDECDYAIRLFREYYNIYGWWDNRLYDGIPELLSELKRRGKTLVLATSKPEDTAKSVLKLFGIDKYFDFIGGADGHKSRDKKHEVLEYSLSAVGCTTPEARSRAIMIGDRLYDAEGAAALGIASIGVLWGHGSAEEIASSGFTLTAEKPCDVAELLG